MSGEDRPVDGPRRGTRTHEALRHGAHEAFAELGWQGTRIQDIVTRAGVSHGTFYNYYPNRAAALDDLVRSSQEEFVALAGAHWGDEDVRGALEHIIGGFLDIYRRDAPIVRTWLQAARDDRSFNDLYRSSRDLFVARVAEQLESTAAASGRADPGPPPRTVASALVAMVEHFAYNWTVLGEDHDPDDALHALLLVWGSTLNTLAGFDLVDPLVPPDPRGTASAGPQVGQ
ncbi:TetR/AcrR family transcriptional regulator [Egibacter rhizosphaerae]|nr:TetR/AcrR family transcriptional regulator [Egibacter rhizosphaerae]